MNKTTRQALRAQAHHLKPVILIGAKGLTQAVIDETSVALTAHELIKIKISGLEKTQREQLALDLCQQLGAELVQTIGHTLVIFRKNPD